MTAYRCTQPNAADLRRVEEQTSRRSNTTISCVRSATDRVAITGCWQSDIFVGFAGRCAGAKRHYCGAWRILLSRCVV